MRCIFCLQERPGSEEHVFPRAIGGSLTIDRLCKRCNSALGSRVDAALSDSFVVRMHRAQLGLAGNSGMIPALHEILLGVHKLAEDPERRIQTRFNKDTGRLDIRHLHHASDVTMPDGTTARQIIVDERDIDQLPKIIQRERKRHGVPPLSEEQLADEVRRAAKNISVINNPNLLIEQSYSFAYLRHALAKIAYELAFLWLGESYLDDPSAAELRAAVCNVDPASTDQLPMWAGDSESCEAFRFWSSNQNHHIAYAFAAADGIAVAVRVFNIHAAIVWVTKDSARYLSDSDATTRLRFLSIEPITRKMRNTSVMDEFLRVAQAITESVRASRPTRDDASSRR